MPTTWSVARARSYVFRLPLLTRGFLAAIVVFWIVGLQPVFDVRAWGGLEPDKVGFASRKLSCFLLELGKDVRRCGRLTANVATVYRLNTFPFIHLNWFHMLMNILALTPLLERFERESGTLTSLALFLGRELALVIVGFWRGTTRSES